MDIKQYLIRAGFFVGTGIILLSQIGCDNASEREAKKYKEAQKVVKEYEEPIKKAQHELYVKDSILNAKITTAIEAYKKAHEKEDQKYNPQNSGNSGGNSNRKNSKPCGSHEQDLEDRLAEVRGQRTIVMQFITNGNATENKSDDSKSNANNSNKYTYEKNEQIRVLQNKHNKNIYMMPSGIGEDKTSTYWENNEGNISSKTVNLRPGDWKEVTFESIDKYFEVFGSDYRINGVRVSTLPSEYVRAFKDALMYAPGWVPRSGFTSAPTSGFNHN